MHRFLPPPAVVALFALAMWAVARTINVGSFAFDAQRPAAIALLLAALALMAAAVFALAAARTTVNPLRPARASTLVTHGVFAYSRNPIYLGDLLVLAAFALWLGNWLNFVLLPLFVAYMNRFQIAPEEHALAARFGAAFAEYCARVRRWV